MAGGVSGVQPLGLGVVVRLPQQLRDLFEVPGRIGVAIQQFRKALGAIVVEREILVARDAGEISHSPLRMGLAAS